MTQPEHPSTSTGERASIELRLWLLPTSDGRQEELGELREALRQAGAERAEAPVIGDLATGRRSASNGGGMSDLIVATSNSVGALSTIVTKLREWLAGRRGRTIRLVIDGNEIEISGISTHNEDRLVDAFVRHFERL